MSRPSVHIAQSIGSTAVLYPIIGGDSAIFGLSVVLIDLDHFFEYVYNTKNLNPKGCLVYHDILRKNCNKNFLHIHLFHTIEFYLLLLILAGSFPILYYVLSGFLFHHLFDQITLINRGRTFERAFSILEYFVRRKNHITSMNRIFQGNKLNTQGIPDLDKWLIKWSIRR